MNILRREFFLSVFKGGAAATAGAAMGGVGTAYKLVSTDTDVSDSIPMKKHFISGAIGGNVSFYTARSAKKEEVKNRENLGPCKDPITGDRLAQNVSRRHLLTTLAASGASSLLVGHGYGKDSSSEYVPSVIAGLTGAVVVYGNIRARHNQKINTELKEKQIADEAKHETFQRFTQRGRGSTN